jgi:hypothetical protein
MIVGVRGTLTKAGAKDIDLTVVAVHDGDPSPYCALTGQGAQIIAGNIATFDDAFDDEVKKYPGYTVQNRSYLEIPDP